MPHPAKVKHFVYISYTYFICNSMRGSRAGMGVRIPEWDFEIYVFKGKFHRKVGVTPSTLAGLPLMGDPREKIWIRTWTDIA